MSGAPAPAGGALPATEPAARPPLPRAVRVFPVLGAALALCVLLLLGVLYVADRPQFPPILYTVLLLYAVGKEGGIPAGIALGGRPALVGLAIYATDLAMALLLYPLVHLAFDGVQRRKGMLGSMVRSAQRHADRSRKVVDRYGAIGIYAFMLIPWAFNGPLVGIALGRIARLPPVRVMATVALAMATTAVAWTLLVAYGYKTFHVNPWVSASLSLGVGACVFAWGYLESRKERRVGKPARDA